MKVIKVDGKTVYIQDGLMPDQYMEEIKTVMNDLDTMVIPMCSFYELVKDRRYGLLIDLETSHDKIVTGRLGTFLGIKVVRGYFPYDEFTLRRNQSILKLITNLN